jgi:hypothetical protein
MATRKSDLSQKGNWENFRNEEFDSEPFTYTPAWQLPQRGVWTFDYISSTRPPADALPLAHDEFEQLVHDYVHLEKDPSVAGAGGEGAGSGADGVGNTDDLNDDTRLLEVRVALSLSSSPIIIIAHQLLASCRRAPRSLVCSTAITAEQWMPKRLAK